MSLASILLFLLCIICVFPYGKCTTTEIYITNDLSSCPGVCRTLQQYANSPSNSSDVILHLTSENHMLSSNLSTNGQNTSSITINAVDAAIVCSSQVNWETNLVGDVQISGVSFMNCGHGYINASRSVRLTNVSFVGCLRTHIYPHLLAMVHLSNMTVIQSHQVEIDGVKYLTIEDSSFMQGKISYLHTYVVYIRVPETSDGPAANITITRSTFSHNVVTDALHIIHYASRGDNITIADTIFDSNVGNDGIGIYYEEIDCSGPMQYTITISGCSFLNNAARPYFLYRTVGGALFLRKFCGHGPGATYIINSSFINNTADYFGALYLFGYLPNFLSNYTITLENCTFIKNSARNGNCGAVGMFTPTRIKVNFTRNMFIGNRATGSPNTRYDQYYSPTVAFGGGAVCVRNASIVTIEANTFSHNTVDTRPGGAMFIGDSTELIIRTSNFTDNRAEHSSADGGVMYMVNATEIRIESSLFLNNIAGRDGGVIYNGEKSSTIEVTHTIFTGNSAGHDGGVMYIDGSGNQVSINASICSFNDANGRGGVVRISSSMIEVTETNIYNNSAEFGQTILACSSTVTVADALHSVTDPQIATCVQYDGYINIYSHLDETPTEAGIVTTSPMTTEEINITNNSDQFCSGVCQTLQQYANNPSNSYNVILHLTSENHTLNSSLFTNGENTDSITIIATDATIICSSQTNNWDTRQLVDVQIIGVSFINCGYVYIHGTGSIILTNVSFIGCLRTHIFPKSMAIVHLSRVLVIKSEQFEIDGVKHLTIEDSRFEQSVTSYLHTHAIYIHIAQNLMDVPLISVYRGVHFHITLLLLLFILFILHQMEIMSQ